jgi:hypothetical protein
MKKRELQPVPEGKVCGAKYSLWSIPAAESYVLAYSLPTARL